MLDSPFSFISPPASENNFNRSHCFIFIHEYIIFPPYSSSYILTLCPPHPTGNNLQTGLVLPSCFSFLKKGHFCMFKIAMQGVSF
jgi:hypothetical protein